MKGTNKTAAATDITILGWDGDDATVTWTDAAGVEQRAVVCCEVEDDGCIAYGGDAVPDEVEAYLAFPAAERHGEHQRDDYDLDGPERGDLETWGGLL